MDNYELRYSMLKERHPVLLITSQMFDDIILKNSKIIKHLRRLVDIESIKNQNSINIYIYIIRQNVSELMEESCCRWQYMKRRRRGSYNNINNNNNNNDDDDDDDDKQQNTPTTTTTITTSEAQNFINNNNNNSSSSNITTTATNETTFLHNCKCHSEVTVATPLTAATTTIAAATTTTSIFTDDICCCWRHCRRKRQQENNSLEQLKLQQQQQQHLKEQQFPAHAADAINNGTANNSKSDNRNQKINNITATTTTIAGTTMLDTTAASTTTRTTTTKKMSSNIANINNNKYNFAKLRNYFNILQFLIFFIQLQVLPYCCNIFKKQHQQQQQQQQQNFAALLATTSIITTTTTRLSVSRNNNNNNNYFNLSQHQLPQQQPQQQQHHKTILPQLSKQVNCATTTTTTKETEKETWRTSTSHNSEQQQRHHHFSNCQIKNDHQHKQQQQQHHQPHQQQGMPKSNKYHTRSKLFYIALLVLSFLTTTLPTINAQLATTATEKNSSSAIIMPQLEESHSRQQMRDNEDDKFAESLRMLTAAPPLASVSLTEQAESSALINKRNAFDLNGSPAKQKGEIKLTRNETLCKSMDIRNEVSSFKQLENCTAIEGFLLISLVNAKNLTETYPLLTEVTEYIVVYRVIELTSLSRIFPNLRVIRGKSLFDGYALVVYSNRDLQDIGLSKLRSIANGGVRIEKNIVLCYIKTIDWTQIVSTNTTDIALKGNRDQKECPKCPGDNKAIDTQNGGENDTLKCPKHQGQRYCWSGKACQTFCPESCRNNCIDENRCCNEACLGGCINNGNKDQCISCRHYAINNTTCIDKCPPGYYTYLDRRCITAKTCEEIGTKFENTKHEPLVHYNGQCTTRCPTGFNKVGSTCERCINQCEKVCEGGIIDSLVRAKDFNGCTQINANKGLTISIKRGGPLLMQALEEGLGSIHTIHSHLKVHLTYGLFSLRFLKRLKQINGEKLYEDEYVFYVLENNDLEEIWAPNQTVNMLKGSVFFHFNAKLCYSTIDALRPMMINQNITQFNKKEVAIDSNGNKGSCNTELLNVTILGIKSVTALVRIDNPIKYGDDRTFIGYQFYHMENPYKNATKHSNQPCDDSWIVSDPSKELNHFFYFLQPYKTYAFYVKTKTISSESRNAQSDIHYFQTQPSKPQYVRQLKASANSHSQIKLSWIPPKYANGNLTNYYIRAVLYNRNSTLESRNYCKDPLKETFNKDDDSYSVPSSEKVNKPTQETPEDCSCEKEGKKGASTFNADNEAARQDEIEFENTLQNFVYVKATNRNTPRASSGALTANLARLHNNAGGVGEELNASQSGGGSLKKRRSIVMEDEIDSDDGNSFLTRHMRSLTDETTNPQDDSDWNSIILSKWPILNSTQTWNDTRTDESGRYIIYAAKINASTTEITLDNLKHFSMYTLGVVACREKIINDTKDDCSEIMLIDKITLKKENVDLAENLVPKLETTNTSRSNVRLTWKPPDYPNGAVVSYTISYEKQDQDTIEEHRCITDAEFRDLGNSYTVQNLPEGNYSMRVRTNSLAGEGLYTERVYIVVPPTRLAAWVIALIIICVLIFFSLLAFMLFYVYIRKKRPPSDLTIFPDVNPFYISLQYIPDDWEIPRESIIQYSPLGRGSFGMVYEGVLKAFHNNTEDTPCAIKTVNENATDRERVNFLREASVMKQFDTYHVVRLLGVCSRGQPALVVMELMKNGDLKSYLRAHRPDECDEVVSTYRQRIGGGDGVGQFPREPPKLERIYQMAIEIADGMAYLSAKKFVHRDLAARNCMVAADLTVKIGDFGMTRDIYETDYYRKGTKGLLPVRWMPPESLRDGVYDSSSDVFSYGVVLWEMVTLASQPYQGLSNDQVLRYVIDGGVMERPENCPDRLYALMQKCWHHRPNARPSFLDIINMLMDVSDPKFRDVSFYHSEEGQQTLKKENVDRGLHGSEPYQDGDNELDDATTPLRVGEYPRYKSNMDNNSSAEQQGDDSPMAGNDDHPNSPCSLHSAFIVSSTPDRQSKNSYNLSHNNPAAGSGPSTSAGIGSGMLTQQLQRPYYGRTATTSQGEDDAAAYVLPDSDSLGAALASDNQQQQQQQQYIATLGTDERGYELYDPSPNNDKMSAYEGTELDDLPLSSKLSGEQHLLPRARGAGQRGMPSIVPMSSSVPDNVIGASLHPSTASAASSNASSSAGAGGRYSSLKRAVAETIAYVPSRLNRHLLNHKRSGSNTSHKSTASNPNTFGSSGSGGGIGVAPANSSKDAGSGSGGGGGGTTSSGYAKSLSTIESGGSGSAGSYTGTPRFFSPSGTSALTTATKPATVKGVTISDNPNYQLLSEPKNTTAITPTTTTTAAAAAAAQSLPSSSAILKKSKPTSPAGNSGVNYKLLNESFNTTAKAPTLPLTATMTASDNPNYELMQAPSSIPQTSINPNYVPMNEPAGASNPTPSTNISENPNYQMMGPSPVPALAPTPTTTKTIQPTSSGNFYKLSSTLSSALRRDQSIERLDNSSTSSSAASSSNEEPDSMVYGPTVQIKMERMPLSQKTRAQRGKHRSRSASQTRKPTKLTASTLAVSPSATTATQQQQQTQAQQQQSQLPSQSQTSAREKWLLEPPRPPPPNGFIGREA